jgi:CAAX prenyl protease-like protein
VLARDGWVVFRVLAAVTTVPLAEELAFRGFLMRWLVAAEFEVVSMRHLSWFAVLASSAVFGVLHGAQWLPGMVAGLAFAAVMLRRGKIGDAVFAHATSNALLAGYVLFYQQWHLW